MKVNSRRKETVEMRKGAKQKHSGVFGAVFQE
jgi:hypothetical protein